MQEEETSPLSAAATGATSSKTREQVSEEALQAWKDSGCYGATLIGTGVGKTKLSILACQYVLEGCQENEFPDCTILWLCSSEQLRDVEAKAEFVKWGYEHLLPHVTFMCYQTFYKLQGTEWDLVVCDEGDAALTQEYSKGLLNNLFDFLLLVTATVKEDKRELLSNICPIVYEYSTQQAQADGLLNQTQFILLEVDLSEQKNIEVKYKKNGQEKSFYTSENDQYQYLETQFGVLCGEQEAAKKAIWSVDMGYSRVTYYGYEDLKKKLSQVEAKIQRIISQRTTALWTSPTLIAAAKALANKILAEENNKVVLFSKRKETAEALGSNVYHSGNKKDNQAIELFNSGEKRGLSVVDAVNRGVNLVGATHALFVGYHSSGVDAQQRVGRMVRLPVDEVATCIFLLPYFKNKAGIRKPTQAVKWFEGLTEQYDLSTATRMSLTNYLQS